MKSPTGALFWQTSGRSDLRRHGNEPARLKSLLCVVALTPQELFVRSNSQYATGILSGSLILLYKFRYTDRLRSVSFWALRV